MKLSTACVAFITLASISQAALARHHITSRGHLIPPIREPFFTAGVEQVSAHAPELKSTSERDLGRTSKQDTTQPIDSRGTVDTMPPPSGPLGDNRAPLISMDYPHKISKRDWGTRHKMPPPNGPLREIRPPLAPFDAMTSYRRENGKLNEANCGHSSVSSSRVVNGRDAVLGEWPWQVGLQFKNTLACGGTLIMPDWVMTAAHCVLNDDPKSFQIVLGDTDRIKTEGSERKLTVKRIIKHRLFSHPVPYENDIALFQLSSKVSLTSFINTVCLPDFLSELPVGTECYISGWGQMFGEGEVATTLQQAAMPIVSNSACAAKLDTSPNGGLHTKDNRTWIVTGKMLCAGDAGKTKTHGCFGDSGGPLQCLNTDGQWVVHGIVSWGDPDCSSQNHYTVFTRVSVFRRWIDKIIKRYSNS